MKKNKPIFLLIIFVAVSGLFVSHFKVNDNSFKYNKNQISLNKTDYNIAGEDRVENYSRAGYTIYTSRSENQSMNEYFVYYQDSLELQINKENYKYVLSFFFPEFNLLFANDEAI